MKKYTISELWEIVQDDELLHNEISKTQGLILFLMKENSIEVSLDSLLVPHMSAWSIPYLYEQKENLSEKQKEILEYISGDKKIEQAY